MGFLRPKSWVTQITEISKVMVFGCGAEEFVIFEECRGGHVVYEICSGLESM